MPSVVSKRQLMSAEPCNCVDKLNCLLAMETINTLLMPCQREIKGGSQVPGVCCPSYPDCGITITSRIAFGLDSGVYGHPWLVLIRDTQEDKIICGGVIIGKHFILTNAHCIIERKKENLIVILGEHDVKTEEDCDQSGNCAPAVQYIGVKKIVPHDKYKRTYKRNDIALLYLEHPATLNETVQPICLPTDEPIDELLDGEEMYVYGGGLTEHGNSSDRMLYAKVSPVSLSKCEEEMQAVGSSIKVGESHICAMGEDKQNHCKGDSGGPLVTVSTHTQTTVLIGIAQFGHEGCGTIKTVGVYVNIHHIRPWILSAVASILLPNLPTPILPPEPLPPEKPTPKSDERVDFEMSSYISASRSSTMLPHPTNGPHSTNASPPTLTSTAAASSAFGSVFALWITSAEGITMVVFVLLVVLGIIAYFIMKKRSTNDHNEPPVRVAMNGEIQQHNGTGENGTTPITTTTENGTTENGTARVVENGRNGVHAETEMSCMNGGDFKH